MRFEESNTMDITNLPTSFIYFLVSDGEVVYVGQTRNGTARPFMHKYDKELDKVYILTCEPEMLDDAEDKYIMKYKPKHNHLLNSNLYYSLSRTRNYIREQCGTREYSKWDLKRDCSTLGITRIVFNNIMYLHVNDVNRILKLHKEGEQ